MDKVTIIIPLADGKKVEYPEWIDYYLIKHIEVYGPNPSANRNKGVVQADTDYVAFINGHTALTNDWLEKVEKFIRDHPEIDIFGGPQFTSDDEPLFGKVSGYALSSKFGVGGVSSRYKAMPLNLNADETMLTSANLICKREVFYKIDFDEKLYPGEDPKFIKDALSYGMKVAYSPDIIVYNRRRDDLKSFAKQIYLYGYTRAKRESLSQTLKHPAFLVPPAFVLYILMLPLTFLVNWFIYPLYLYIVLNVFFSLYEIIKLRDRGNPVRMVLLPVVFLTLHLSYGIGFIRGKLK